ncbi:hypothetical protein B2G71_06105 [Novosphingobium sp. PC22D]|nr:hypothetical protein B2G71_06105 [Novosphingobium sp. PC22D]
MARGEWLGQLDELSLACLGSPAEQEADRLREFNELLYQAPETELIEGLRPASQPRLEALIEAQALDSALLAMLDSVAYMVSGSGQGGCMATVVLPGVEHEQSAAAPTLTLATISALAQALAEAASETTKSPLALSRDCSLRLH